jgi:hypothetical protein
MALKSKFSIAEEYLKKSIISYSGNVELVSDLIFGYSKIVKKYYTDLKGITFVLDTVRKSAIDNIHEGIFSNLFLFAQLNGNNKKEVVCPIYEEKLNCFKFRKDVNTWLAYIGYLNHVKVEG